MCTEYLLNTNAKGMQEAFSSHDWTLQMNSGQKYLGVSKTSNSHIKIHQKIY